MIVLYSPSIVGADETMKINVLWQRVIADYLNKINVKNSESLYEVQSVLMVPVWSSFRVSNKGWQQQFTLRFSEIVEQTMAISKLRELATMFGYATTLRSVVA